MPAPLVNWGLAELVFEFGGVLALLLFALWENGRAERRLKERRAREAAQARADTDTDTDAGSDTETLPERGRGT